MQPARSRLAVGVDPGLANSAWALVEQREDGHVRLVASEVYPLRGRTLADKLASAAGMCNKILLVTKQEKELCVVAVEDMQCLQLKNRAVFAAGAALYTGLCVAFDPGFSCRPADVQSISPTAWKRILGIPCRGKHGLNKQLALELASRTFGIEFRTDHEADAALIALAALKDRRWEC
jgi:Holliday junction resolvasome RuvABC endonuclease subunit